MNKPLVAGGATTNNHVPGLFNTSSDKVSVAWFWEPYHRPGVRAVEYAHEKNISAGDFARFVGDLSCLAPTKEIETRLKKEAPQALDSEGRLLPLNPETYISETARLVNEGRLTHVMTITELQKALGPEVVRRWRPRLNDSPDLQLLSSWLTKTPRLMKTFQALDPWKKLELIECLVGVTKSCSTLDFERIYDT